jgi:hypothetical protein
LSGRAAGWLGAAACAGALGAVVAAVACIPDLQDPATAADSGDDAAPVTPCGDGIVDLDAGEQCDPGQHLPDGATFAGCTAHCRMDCREGVVWALNNHCYARAPNRATTELQAIGQCTENAHVATFASVDELQFVTGTIEAGPFWVGLGPNGSGQTDHYAALQLFEPGWSPQCAGCFAYTDTPDASLPTVTGTQGCVEGLLDASWRQYPCAPDAGRLYVICEREPWGSTARRCDAGLCIDIPWTFGSKRYVYIADQLTADQASARCASLGGTLAVFTTRDEREQIWYELAHTGTVLGSPAGTDIWIGLSLTDAGWVWDDESGADAYQPPWASGQPDEKPGHERAYVHWAPTPPPTPIDLTLATNTNTTSTGASALCQIPVGAPDAGDAGEAGTEDASDAGASE